MNEVMVDGAGATWAGGSTMPRGLAHMCLGGLLLLLTITLPNRAASAEESWQFITESYVFLASLDGNTSVGRAEGDIHADFSDILKNLKIAATLNAEATNNRWGIISDIQYMKLGLKRDLEGDRFAKFTTKMTIFETEVFYRWHLGERATLDAFAGVRYWNNRLYLTLSGPLVDPTVRRAADWLDPLVGVRVIVPLTESLAFRIRGDIGGFGVGSSFSWQVLAGFVYDVSRSFAVTLGYRYLDVDYSRGEPDTPERFVFDAAMHGPQLGFRLTF